MEEHIGDFTAYHDEEKSAALVYFKRSGTLVSTIFGSILLHAEML